MLAAYIGSYAAFLSRRNTKRKKFVCGVHMVISYSHFIIDSEQEQFKGEGREKKKKKKKKRKKNATIFQMKLLNKFLLTSFNEIFMNIILSKFFPIYTIYIYIFSYIQNKI